MTSYTWLQQHRRECVLIAVGIIVVAAIALLEYLGNQTDTGEIVPVVADRSAFGVTEGCERDPAALAAPRDATGAALNYFHTCGNRLYDSQGREVLITGINWFGMETANHSPDGLWSRNWQTVLDQIAALGYNAIRLPFSNEILDDSAPVGGINYAINPDLAGLTGLQIMDKIIQGAGQRGLRVLLDRHRPTSAGQTPLWYSQDVDEQRWIADWVKLAQRYAKNDTVFGVDLHNEPRDNATWGSGDISTDWELAAERAGNAILDANPYLLIFVQGVSRYGNDYYWWGGQLAGVARHPAHLNIPNRVVYSPHDYGPEVFEQGWFEDPTFPRNLPGVWNSHWGFIARQNLAPVVVGEFGGRSVGDDPGGLWQRALLEYMHRNNVGFFNWSLNPNSGDTGGLLSDDWLSVVQDKQNVYRAYLSGPLGRRVESPAGTLRVLYRATNVDTRTANVAFSLEIVNDGTQPVDLSHVELRYWLQAGRLGKGQQIADVDYAAVGNDRVKAEVKSASRDTQDSYVEITFVAGTPVLGAYQNSGEIMIRVHKSDWATYTQASAYSFQAQTSWQQADRIAMFRDGQLVWGNEPPMAEANRP